MDKDMLGLVLFIEVPLQIKSLPVAIGYSKYKPVVAL